ncbi:sulfatase family protein [Paenibacillus cymbidii]|uniref:sulfatase family protein n=1 Tax=Paenibacillus cymbidii TaxID=1639034 RepID=UPI001081C42F|nr:sulfatase [Paenibacillus cymbidii]
MRIIYFDIDSLRPDHMGCYGYPRNTTPNIDNIASQGVRFNRQYCAASPCVPSRASFMTGRFAINHGALTHWGPGSELYYPDGDPHSGEYPFFTRYLREAGYKAITFSSFGDRHKAWWYFAGWNEIHTHTLKCGNEDANEVAEHVIPWLKQHGTEDNYFLHIQFWDPHGFYTCPDEYANQFQGQPTSEFPDEATIAQHRSMSHPRSATFLQWSRDIPIPQKMPYELNNRDDFVRLINGYDGGIRYADHHIGQIMQTFRELGIEEEVCIIVSADHGESFGEQGIYMEHGMATESVHHLPLIIKIPGVTSPGQIVDDFVYNVDLIGTLTELVGLDIPQGWDGQSFLPVLRGQTWQGRDYLVLEHGLFACQRAVCDRRWYFIRTYHEGLYEFDPVVLYDMENDPHQTANVAAEHPDIVQLMDHRLSAWLQDNARKHGHIVDPMQEVIRTGPFRYMQPHTWVGRLRQEGWDKQADDLQKYITI